MYSSWARETTQTRRRAPNLSHAPILAEIDNSAGLPSELGQAEPGLGRQPPPPSSPAQFRASRPLFQSGRHYRHPYEAEGRAPHSSPSAGPLTTHPGSTLSKIATASEQCGYERAPPILPSGTLEKPPESAGASSREKGSPSPIPWWESERMHCLPPKGDPPWFFCPLPEERPPHVGSSKHRDNCRRYLFPRGPLPPPRWKSLPRNTRPPNPALVRQALRRRPQGIPTTFPRPGVSGLACSRPLVRIRQIAPSTRH